MIAFTSMSVPVLPMLVSMGAKISGIGSNLLSIEGVDGLKGCTHRMLPDMIEVGSFIGLAAMTQSEITIKNVGYEHLGIIPDTFKRLGIQMELKGDDIYIPSQKNYEIDTYIDGSSDAVAGKQATRCPAMRRSPAPPASPGWTGFRPPPACWRRPWPPWC